MPSLPNRKLIRLLSPILFIATICITFFLIMSSTPESKGEYLRFSTVGGYFLQDDPKTEDKGFDYATTNFGLIDRAYDADKEFEPQGTKTQWQRFDNQITFLNRESDENVEYKVLYMGRHGQGYHNVAESFYGTKAWDCYWSLQPGNTTSTWLDAHLTQTGISEAQKANTFWASLITTQKILTPQSYYSSPLIRCIQTAYHTFHNLSLPSDRPFAPLIKEGIREVIGVHTCDQRSTKTEIEEFLMGLEGNGEGWRFEEGFREGDELWSSSLRETAEAQDQRTKVVLDDIFWGDGNTHISISSHSGEIASILRVLGHREFRLGTGQMIPVLVKIERVKGTLPPVIPAPWEKPETCTEPPTML